jgi:lipopolysaccharide/colanic/teichoic acid biosynthesis glycosyltransferase
MTMNNDIYQNIKRFIDIILASILWLLFSPVIIVTSLMVKLTSKGPAFYKWQVVGEKGKYFHGFKLRSMCRNADEIKAKLLQENEMLGPAFKMADDPRITPLGRILRKYSLDELPQLWSVINGDMTLVGPRPPLQSEYEQFTEWQKKKLEVKPGITCIWQTTGRNDIRDFDEWVRLDLKYIRERTLRLDMRILLDTLKCALKGTGK